MVERRSTPGVLPSPYRIGRWRLAERTVVVIRYSRRSERSLDHSSKSPVGATLITSIIVPLAESRPEASRNVGGLEKLEEVGRKAALPPT